MPSTITNIRRITPGGESLVSANRANQLIDAVNALRGATIVPATNFGKVTVTGNQVIYDYSQLDQRLQAAENGSGGGGSLTFPFQINNTSVGNTAQVNVRFGTVMDVVPTGIAADIGISSNVYVFLNCTINNNAVVTAAAVSTANAVPAHTTFQAYKLIGQVNVAANIPIINQSLMFSQGFQACDRNTTAPNSDTKGTYYFFVD